MTTRRLHRLAWDLARRQHWVISREQLLDMGFTPSAIRHRIAKGRLHPVHRGVYAVGRRELAAEGRLMAAILRCGSGAYLSHMAAAGHWGICRPPHGAVDISVNAAVLRTSPGIRVHRRRSLTEADVTVHQGIPITTPVRTLIDIATSLAPRKLETAVVEADVRGLVDPETLRAQLEKRPGQPGTRPLREILDRHTFRLTDSELERRFLRIVRKAGLPLPDTQVRVGGRVDFHWPSLGLVVETDGWRYHRTPARQASDNRRMQAHAAAGRTAIRISHYEIRYEADRVVALVTALVRRGSRRYA